MIEPANLQRFAKASMIEMPRLETRRRRDCTLAEVVSSLMDLGKKERRDALWFLAFYTGSPPPEDDAEPE